MPAPYEFNKPHEEGTQPPLPEHWSSPWVGKSVEDCARWLQKMPTYEGPQYYHHTSVDREYFVAMDEFSMEDDTIMACRATKKKDAKTRVDYVPMATAEVQMYMWTNDYYMFLNKAEAYQGTVRVQKKPDRSRFATGLYQFKGRRY
jgi:hypothetical protein